MRPPALLVAVALAGAACTGGGASGPPTTLGPNTVVAKDFAFTPGTMTVPVGTTVTWQIDQPDAPHNVVSLDGPTSFNSGVPVGRGTFHYTFAQVGTWTYTCLVHPSMKGTVIVSP